MYKCLIEICQEFETVKVFLTQPTPEKEEIINALFLDFMECFFCEFDHCGRVYKVDFMKKSLHNCTLKKLLYLRCFLLAIKFSTVFCWILTLIFERKVIL